MAKRKTAKAADTAKDPFLVMPFEAYRALPGINASALKAGQKSMLHMRAELLGLRERETASMGLGRVVHAAVLEPETFAKRVLPWDGVRRGKEYDQAVDEYGKDWVVTRREFERALSMSQAVHQHPVASGLIRTTRHELTVTWDGTSYKAKARLDGLSDTALIDYKTTHDCAPRAFGRTAGQLGYVLQMAWYLTGVRTVTGASRGVYLVAQENDPPWDVAVYLVPADLLAVFAERCLDIAERYVASEKAGVWRGQAWDVLNLEVPDWSISDTLEEVMCGAEAV